jgi:cytidyltransferase-like protein
MSIAADRVHQRDKIVTIEALPAIRERFRAQRIIHCHGAFDLVHPGHLIHFEEARALGDLLVVTVTGDRHITKKRSIAFTEDQRARQVAALEIVDYVAVIQEPTALSAIEALHPDVYVKGPEYADLTLDKSRSIYHEMQVLAGYGGKMHFTAGETFSSTKLSHFLMAAPDAAQRDPLLRNDRVRFRDISSFGFTLDDLKQFVARAAPLRVCVIGETIVDEWVDVALTNLSTQSRCVAGLERARVAQSGGVGIIARHLASFVREVDCFSNGEAVDPPSNVRQTALAEGTLVETRFVDAETGRPIFKSKSMTLSDAHHDRLPRFDDYELVLIADFGHGLLDAAQINRRICERKHATVAAMAQVNSSNFGYNLPIKYAGADYYTLNRTEAELCLHERHLALDDLVTRSAQLLRCGSVSVTDGDHGVAVTHAGERFTLPSLSASVIDTIGCGDAYLALSSVALRLNMPARLIALAGSIGAAAMTQRRCNESAVTEQEFMTIGKIVI